MSPDVVSAEQYPKSTVGWRDFGPLSSKRRLQRPSRLPIKGAAAVQSILMSDLAEADGVKWRASEPLKMAKGTGRRIVYPFWLGV
jgi:hypothetical protein